MPQQKERITIADVAKYAQVSMMTVSRVVNNRGQVSDAMKQRVLNAMDELGYKPNRIARSLVSNRTYKIGVIVPTIAGSFFTEILESAERVLWKHGYYMVLCNSGNENRREQDILNIFEEDRVDGVLIFGSHLNYEQLTNLLANQRAGVVFNGEVDPQVAGQILMNQEAAIEMAVKYLISVGRTHLGYVGLNSPTYAIRERKQTFENVVKQSFIDGWVMLSGRADSKMFLPQYLQDFPQTNGIICFNDEIAAEVLRILADLGKKVPDEIAVIGFDNLQLATWVTPKLTTISLRMSISELGELAANMLLDRIEGKVDDQPRILSHDLIIRDSTP